MALLESLSEDQIGHFLFVSLEHKTLLKLAGRLGTVAKGARLDTLSAWDLVWSLADFYTGDPEVSRAVDKELDKALGEPRLAPLFGAEGGGEALLWLFQDCPDPPRDLLWAAVHSGGEDAGKLAARFAERLVLEFDAAEQEANQAEGETPAGETPAGETPAGEAEPAPEPAGEEVDRELRREAQRARAERDRALSKSESLRERLAEVETLLADARREAKAAQGARERAEAEAVRLGEELQALRARVDRGLQGELEAARGEIESTRRRIRALEGELDEARAAAAELQSRVRAAEARSAAPAAQAGAGEAAPEAVPATWSLPVFTDEFYDSIRRWDRKIVRIAFEKIVRLAEDWRHPSLRAIPLEGLDDVYRIRIASDVRLIYRPLEGGRVEILSLIDREDLQRYIRTVKRG